MEATHQIIMKKTFSILILLLATMTSVALTACGGDDDEPANPDNPNVPSQSDVVKETTSFPGGIGFNAIWSYGANSDFWLKFDSNNGSQPHVCFDHPSWCVLKNLKIGNYGNVNTLQSITSLSKIDTWISSPWSSYDGPILNEKDGFIIEGTSSGKLYYYRLWAKKFTYNASNELIGIDWEWQQFTPNN